MIFYNKNERTWVILIISKGTSGVTAQYRRRKENSSWKRRMPCSSAVTGSCTSAPEESWISGLPFVIFTYQWSSPYNKHLTSFSWGCASPCWRTHGTSYAPKSSSPFATSLNKEHHLLSAASRRERPFVILLWLQGFGVQPKMSWGSKANIATNANPCCINTCLHYGVAFEKSFAWADEDEEDTTSVQVVII